MNKRGESLKKNVYKCCFCDGDSDKNAQHDRRELYFKACLQTRTCSSRTELYCEESFFEDILQEKLSEKHPLFGQPVHVRSGFLYLLIQVCDFNILARGYATIK